ncbi:MAG: hypothetical protein PHW34_07480 [Hespellia sp.]|nr:hypothetical protein [Hespellia sp.]
MKKKIGIILASLVLVMGIVLALTKAHHSSSSLMAEWGMKLRDFAGGKEEQDTSKVYAQGEHATVTQDEIEQAKQFFITSGLSESEAEEKAISYSMEREAMYEKALQEGYDVTDEEVDEYLNELKSMMSTAENKTDIEVLISQFDSEEEYWQYQKEVYRKNLPIQKYVSDLQQQYDGNGQETDTADEWNHYLEQYKTKVVQEENYIVTK